MSVAAWIAMALAGGAGAAARYGVLIAFERMLLLAAPAAILAVNVSGTLVIGLLAGAGLHGEARAIAATGFLGGYTTFSTWMVHSDESARERDWHWAAGNLVVSLLVGFGAVALGVAIG